MKKPLLYFILFASHALWGAIGNRTPVIDILSLPLKNQKQLLKDSQETIEALSEIAKNQKVSFDIRWKAMMALGQMSHYKTQKQFVNLASQKEWFVKNGVLVSMAENEHPEKQTIAKKLLQDPSLIVRSSAVDLLIQEDGNRDLLWAELFNKINSKRGRSLWVRGKIINYLNRNPKSYERQMYERLLAESEPEIKQLAIKGLDRMMVQIKVTDPQTATELARKIEKIELSCSKNKY